MKTNEITRTEMSASEFTSKADNIHAGSFRCNDNVFQRIAVSGVTLENRNISRGEFQFSSFTDVTFNGISFEGTEFNFAQFERVTFQGCHLGRSSFDFTQMSEVTFKNCDLNGASFDFAMGKIRFENCILQGAEFHHTMAALDLKSCSGERIEVNYSPSLVINAEECDFHRGEFSDSVYSGTMSRCIFTDACFCGSNGVDLLFTECVMRDIDTSGATGILPADEEEEDDDLDFEL